jgi:hypothetical protein
MLRNEYKRKRAYSLVITKASVAPHVLGSTPCGSVFLRFDGVVLSGLSDTVDFRGRG